MRILVFSDSHGYKNNIERIIIEQNSVKEIFFCGDGEDEILSLKQKYSEKNFHIIKGNCDYRSNLPIVKFFQIENKKVMLTHGHSYFVKSSLDDLKFAAKQNNVDIAVFGHTHNALCLYENGIYYINPGSSSGYDASFAIIDINNDNIFAKIIEFSKIK
ncbi:MAG: metallophosphoesterase [Clostridia bacterium]